jgi:NNP family nitrate/nitrite transporter-like MFS transporter
VSDHIPRPAADAGDFAFKSPEETKLPPRERTDFVEDPAQGRFVLNTDPEQDDRATEFRPWWTKGRHMAAFHASWTSFFFAFFAWFAVAPLLPIIKKELGLSKDQMWVTNICSVSSTVAMRFIVGPLCDLYGPKMVMACCMIVGSLPTFLIGTVTTYTGLCVTRFFIGMIGASFVMCQYWTSLMFAKDVVGQVNAVAGGWGNLGGGVTHLFMGGAMVPLFEAIFNHNEDLVWRSIFIVPGTMTVLSGIAILLWSMDTPHGDFSELKARGELPAVKASSFLNSLANPNTLIAMMHYACCFGMELTMFNFAGVYFNTKFEQGVERAASIAGAFGFMNIASRGFGGYMSDYANTHMNMRGRLLVQFCTLLMEGLMIVTFSQMNDLGPAIAVLTFFGFFAQMGAGTTFGFVPFIDPANNGGVYGAVGAGGNMGAIFWGLCFLYSWGSADQDTLKNLGYIVIAISFTTFAINIPGHSMLIGGTHNPSLQKSNSRKSFGSTDKLQEKKGDSAGTVDKEAADKAAGEAFERARNMSQEFNKA